jgi:hypothetical protein
MDSWLGDNDGERDTVKCVECRQPIPAGARVCRNCSSFQVRWKNDLKYISTIVGVLTAIAALIVYFITVMPTLRKNLAWKDHIQVLEFLSNREVVLTNDGDGPVFVSHIAIEASYKTDSGKFFIWTWPVSAEVQAGAIAIRQVVDEHEKTLEKSHSKFVTVDNDTQWSRALRNAGSALAVEEGAKCFVRVIMSESHPLHIQARQTLGPRFRTFPVTARVHYYSLSSQKTIVTEFQVVGMLWEHLRDRCKGVD